MSGKLKVGRSNANQQRGVFFTANVLRNFSGKKKLQLMENE
jgi:hypothetical protein